MAYLFMLFAFVLPAVAAAVWVCAHMPALALACAVVAICSCSRS